MPTTIPAANRRSDSLHKSALSPVPRTIDVRSLLGNDQFVMIEHGDCRYVLRMTRNNKLILTK